MLHINYYDGTFHELNLVCSQKVTNVRHAFDMTEVMPILASPPKKLSLQVRRTFR